jgi:hypothetical protein
MARKLTNVDGGPLSGWLARFRAELPRVKLDAPPWGWKVLA